MAKVLFDPDVTVRVGDEADEKLGFGRLVQSNRPGTPEISDGSKDLTHENRLRTRNASNGLRQPNDLEGRTLPGTVLFKRPSFFAQKTPVRSATQSRSRRKQLWRPL